MDKKDKEKTMQDVVAEVIEPRLKEQFIHGTIVGWDACLTTIYEHCKSMTNANKIKEYLQSKIAESKSRTENLKKE